MLVTAELRTQRVLIFGIKIIIPLDFQQCSVSCQHGKVQQESASPAGEIPV